MNQTPANGHEQLNSGGDAHRRMNIVILGLSVTSSWGNGHATTYRGLIRALTARGHDVLFLERDVAWYAANRDEPSLPPGRVELYRSINEMKVRFGPEVRDADLVIVGSYLPEGIAVGEWVTRIARGVTAFYDIDTPVTLAKLANGGAEYVSTSLVPHYDLYLSFTGGPVLSRIKRSLGARTVKPLYCSVDPSAYYPQEQAVKWDMGYMGTISPDRQPALDELLLKPARRWTSGRFAVADPQYPAIDWPANVERIDHLPAAAHRDFYNSQRFTLNLTRADMIALGYSPSARLFEAAACGTPVITDSWPGLESFFKPGEEILMADSSRQVLEYLRTISEADRLAVGERARKRVLANHTAAHRALELECYVAELVKAPGAASEAFYEGGDIWVYDYSFLG